MRTVDERVDALKRGYPTPHPSSPTPHNNTSNFMTDHPMVAILFWFDCFTCFLYVFHSVLVLETALTCCFTFEPHHVISTKCGTDAPVKRKALCRLHQPSVELALTIQPIERPLQTRCNRKE